MNYSLDNHIIGQIISAQNILHVFDAESRLADFLLNLLGSIPSVEKCGVCFDGILYSGSLDCGRKCCLARVDFNGLHDSVATHYECVYDTSPDFKSVPFNTLERTYGHFIIFSNNRQTLDSYLAFIQNLSNSVALNVENRWQKKLLKQEVSDLEKTREELKQSEEKYRTIAENMADVITTLDMDLNFIYVSPSITKLRGFTVEEALDQTIEQIMTPESFQLLSEIFAEEIILEQSGTADPSRAREIELEEYKKDGSTIWVENTASFIRDSDKKLIGILVISRDITERKQMEEKLQENEERLRLVIKGSSDAPWDWDLITNDLYYSPQWWSQIGYNPDELPSDAALWQRLMHPDDYDRVNSFFQTALENGTESYEVEFRLIHKKGHYVPVLSRGFISRDNTGSPIRVSGTNMDLTELKNIEAALKKSETLHREAQRVAKIGHWELDSPSGAPVWSEEIFRIFGLDPIKDAPSFAEHKHIIHSQDWPMLEKSISNLSTDGTSFDIQFRILRPDGQIGWMHALGSAEKDNDGNVLNMFGIAQDISERKQFEEKLRDSEEKLRTIIDQSPFPVAFTDTNDEKIIYWSQSALEMFGHNPDTVSEWYELAYPDPAYRKQVINRWKPLLEKASISNKGINTGEYNIVCKDGKVKVCEIYAQFIPGNLVVTMNNITERKMAEKSLSESEKRYRSLFDESPISLWEEDFSDVKTYIESLLDSGVKDLRDYFKNHPEALNRCAGLVKVVDVNSATLGLYDAETIENFREGLSTVFGEETYDVFIEELIALANGETTFESEVTTRTLKGDKNNIFMKCSVAKGFEENLSKVYISIIDISALRKAELEKKKLQAQLVQTQKMESIGNLAGGIAHDFNNILSSIIGFTELALDDTSKGTALEDSLQEVYSAGKRAKTLVKQILAFARQSDEKRSPLQPGIVTKEVLKLVRSTIPTTIEIRQNLDSDSWIMGNATQVHQILMNLCANAAHAMEESGGVLDVSLKDVFVDKEKLSIGMKQGDYIEIKVSDTGVGIPPEIIGLYFRALFYNQGNRRGNRHGAGHGAGCCRKLWR
jgi:PAS domain S-box-containing protein